MANVNFKKEELAKVLDRLYADYPDLLMNLVIKSEQCPDVVLTKLLLLDKRKIWIGAIMRDGETKRIELEFPYKADTPGEVIKILVKMNQ